MHFIELHDQAGHAIYIGLHHIKRVEAPAAPVVGPASNATEALDRVTIPPDALERISELMSPGASLVISDKGLGGETGKGTDFIVLTR